MSVTKKLLEKRLNEARVGLARMFLERAAAQGWKDNKTGAGHAIEFFCGAAALAGAIGDEPLAGYLRRLALLVAIRGIAEVRTLAKEDVTS